MTFDPPKSVGVILTPNYWYLYQALCRELKNRYGTKIWFYVGNAESLKFLEQTCEDKFYDGASIYNFQDDGFLLKNNSERKEVIEESLKWESFLGCKFQEIFVADRQFGRGYALGAPYYARSYKSEQSTYEDALNFYNRQLDFWKAELEEKEMSAFLSPSKLHYLLGRAMEIPIRELLIAKHKDYYFWTSSEQLLNDQLNAEYEALKDITFSESADNDGVVFDQAYRKQLFSVRSELLAFCKDAAARIISRVLQHLKKDEARFGNYVLSAIKGQWRALRNKRRLLDPKFVDSYKDIIGQKYIYYPLQHEPEISLQGCSQDFMCQLWAIALCAKSLPADMRLVVKEHIYPMGVRPHDFYQQIRDIKNVMIAPLDVIGLDLIKNSQAVCTISGTSGYEAAISGIPAIVLRTQCDFAFLDHVYHCPRGEGLEAAIEAIQKLNKQQNKSAEDDGRRFLAALKNSAFRVENFSRANKKDFKKGNIEAAVDALLASIDLSSGRRKKAGNVSVVKAS